MMRVIEKGCSVKDIPSALTSVPETERSQKSFRELQPNRYIRASIQCLSMILTKPRNAAINYLHCSKNIAAQFFNAAMHQLERMMVARRNIGTPLSAGQIGLITNI